jgi:hypothetical protein
MRNFAEASINWSAKRCCLATDRPRRVPISGPSSPAGVPDAEGCAPDSRPADDWEDELAGRGGRHRHGMYGLPVHRPRTGYRPVVRGHHVPAWLRSAGGADGGSLTWDGNMRGRLFSRVPVALTPADALPHGAQARGGTA